jgi:hypothetical protein
VKEPVVIGEVSELAGKTIERVQVYTNVVLIKLSDGKTITDVRVVEGELRVQVTSKGPEGAPPGVRVYPGMAPRAKMPGEK